VARPAGSLRMRNALGTAEGTMDHVYKSIELTGSSPSSVDDAIQKAITKASKSLHQLRWFEVMQVRGHIENGAVAHYQVTMKVGFTLDE
jgi:dodecin